MKVEFYSICRAKIVISTINKKGPFKYSARNAESIYLALLL